MFLLVLENETGQEYSQLIKVDGCLDWSLYTDAFKKENMEEHEFNVNVEWDEKFAYNKANLSWNYVGVPGKHFKIILIFMLVFR